MGSTTVTTDLVNLFEQEQKTVVFSALSEYLQRSTFTDVSLACRNQVFNAHKIVLASSCKFFRDIFKQDPGIQVVDLDKELAPNGISLTFEDVQLIIGILYCVGTVEISPQRIEYFLLVVQVLGIPTLITFLKRIKASIGGDATAQQQVYGAVKYPQQLITFIPPPPPQVFRNTNNEQAVVYLVPPHQTSSTSIPQLSIRPQETSSTDNAEQHQTCQDRQSLTFVKPPPESSLNTPEPRAGPSTTTLRPPQKREVEETDLSQRPSPTASRGTLASLSSFSFQPLASPREPYSVDPGSHPSKIVSSVLESLDPSFLNQLNNLQANQIDDLERALLPHFHNVESRGGDEMATSPRNDCASHAHNKPANVSPGRSVVDTQPRCSTPQDKRRRRHEPINLSSSSRGFGIIQVPGIPPNPLPTETSINRNIFASFNKLLPTTQNLSATPVQLRPGKSPLPLPPKPSSESSPRPPVSLDVSLRDEEELVIDENRSPSVNDLRTVDLNESIERLSVPPPSAGENHSAQAQLASESPDEIPKTGHQQALESPEQIPKAGQRQAVESPEQIPRAGPSQQVAIESESSSFAERSKKSEQSEPLRKIGTPTEISVNLNDVERGSSFRLAIPGSSNSVTLNFSADAIVQMKNKIKAVEGEVSSSTKDEDISGQGAEENEQEEVRDGRPKKRKKGKKKASEQKSLFQCHMCPKMFSSKKLLDRHLPYHVANKNPPCSVCGKIFSKKWALDQHMALEHEKDLFRCSECDKMFCWKRNLLAHHRLYHKKEVRFRCLHCPLKFLRKKIYIDHCKNKHPDAPKNWCENCLEIFENKKHKEDHSCRMLQIDNLNCKVVCHKHDSPMYFGKEKDLQAHLKEFHPDDKTDIKQPCPICNKKFLYLRNLTAHMRKMHETEGKELKFGCSFCEKRFRYEKDKLTHENTHNEGKKKALKCEICDKGYSSMKALKVHHKSQHSSEPPKNSTCHLCGKVLSSQYKLKDHMMTHSDFRSFHCDKCDIKFKDKCNLRRHCQTIHRQEEPTNEKSSQENAQ